MTPSRPFATWAWSAGANLFEGLLDLFLPATCGVCGLASQGPLCGPCLACCRVPPGPCCPSCGSPWTGAGCGRCRRFGRPFAFRSAVALWRYDGPVRRLVHAFKYAGGHQLLEPLGRRMALDPRVSAWCQSRPASLVVPVPLQRVARRRRGYNQAALLAAGLARGAGLEHEAGALRRRRAGAPQAGAEVCERRRRARAAYAACPARVGGRRILLVDDVLSTGATADACSRALRLAGAVEVTVAVLAT